MIDRVPADALTPGNPLAPPRVVGRPRPRFRRRGWRGRAVTVALLLVVALIALFPLYWMTATAVTPGSAAVRVPPTLLPLDGTLENFTRLFTQAPILLWAFNSLVIAVAIMIGHVIFDSMAGYAFAKKSFPGRTLLFTLIVSSLMIPVHVTLVPRFILVNTIGLVDNPLGVVLPSIADVFGIFLMRQFIASLPSELEDAARVDGASEWQVFRHVIMPLSRPAVATVAIFSFVGAWNAFLWPLIVLSDSRNLTLPVGIASLQAEFTSNVGLVMAGAVVGAIPMIVLFLLFQRYFLEGVRVGALKG